jgi:uncharacterized protein YoaH (UPF0181 family)
MERYISGAPSTFSGAGGGSGGIVYYTGGIVYTAGNDLVLSGTTFSLKDNIDVRDITAVDISGLGLYNLSGDGILINNSGFVGINLSGASPTHHLDVSGNVRITGNLTANQFVGNLSGDNISGVNITATDISSNHIYGHSISGGTITATQFVGELSGDIPYSKLSNPPTVGDGGLTEKNFTGTIASAIVANTAKTGITTGQADAIVANTAKTGITTGQADAIVANTAKTGITTGQADAIVANTAKVGHVGETFTNTFKTKLTNIATTVFGTGSASHVGFKPNTNGQQHFYIGGSGTNYRKVILSATNVGGSGDAQLYFVLNGTWKSFNNFTSDSRIKLNQTEYPIEDSMNIVRSIKVKKYYNTDLKREVKGFIAQEVEQILPEAVETHDLSEFGKFSDLKMLDYRRLQVHSFGAIHYLEQKILALEQRILELENRI